MAGGREVVRWRWRMAAEASCCVGTTVEGRAREWCAEVRWRLGAALAFYRGAGDAGDAVTGVVSTGVDGLCH
jgi:hypothetical protein